MNLTFLRLLCDDISFALHTLWKKSLYIELFFAINTIAVPCFLLLVVLLSLHLVTFLLLVYIPSYTYCFCSVQMVNTANRIMTFSGIARNLSVWHWRHLSVHKCCKAAEKLCKVHRKIQWQLHTFHYYCFPLPRCLYQHYTLCTDVPAGLIISLHVYCISLVTSAHIIQTHLQFLLRQSPWLLAWWMHLWLWCRLINRLTTELSSLEVTVSLWVP